MKNYILEEIAFLDTQIMKIEQKIDTLDLLNGEEIEFVFWVVREINIYHAELTKAITKSCMINCDAACEKAISVCKKNKDKLEQMESKLRILMKISYIKKHIEKKHLRWGLLKDRTGLSSIRINEIINRTGKGPTQYELTAVANALDIPILYLL